MPDNPSATSKHRRTSSSSTVRVAASKKGAPVFSEPFGKALPIQAAFWIHDDSFSTEDILINPSILGSSSIEEGSLIEVTAQKEASDVYDFENGSPSSSDECVARAVPTDASSTNDMVCLCIAKFATSEVLAKHQSLEVSMTRTIAESFGLRSRSPVVIRAAKYEDWTASHIELTFRDAYLSRSDMWRLVSQELAGKVVYKGQKVSFLGSMKLIVKDVHVGGQKVSTGFFSGATVPVFRSEAARYVLFIQMSREMWDFDSEGNGEIMFNRVVNGFLPELFRRWVLLEVRHLVSIVMFGRLDYDFYDFSDPNPTNNTGLLSQSSSTSNNTTGFYQDFYRVVVTDMASAQWTTILNELKKDFRVFLRDISLHTPVTIPIKNNARTMPPKITGRPSTALKGNILEAINMASSQFANDYIDRDLIRTGVSTVVITAGAGVFDVDRDLLNLTSENLTNNGIGIDIVCLSKMPLHSVPLFRYRLPQSASLSRVDSSVSNNSPAMGSSHHNPSLPSMNHSSALSSFTGTSANYFSRFPSAFPSKLPQPYGYGIPQWIDLSYWSPSSDGLSLRRRDRNSRGHRSHTYSTKHQFVPRVRMYELQMMGLMELGMADISIPYIADTNLRQKRPRRHTNSDGVSSPLVRNLSRSPTHVRRGNPLAARQRDAVGILGQKVKAYSTTFESMEDYDELLFLGPMKSSTMSKKAARRKRSPKVEKQEIDAYKRSPLSKNHKRVKEKDSLKSAHSPPPASNKAGESNRREASREDGAKSKQPRISRSISYALRGLTPQIRSAAIVGAKLENIKALPSVATTSLTQANATAPSQAGRAESIRSYDLSESDTRSIMSAGSSKEQSSKPISITASGYRPVSQQVSHKLEASVRTKTVEEVSEKDQPTTWLSSPSPSEDEAIKALGKDGSAPGSVPRNTLPFIRNVNASNPLKRPPKATSAFGRWQHLYPHRPHNSTVKWRSLCTPASVPLTTDDFPSARDLDAMYEKSEHTVKLRSANDVPEVPVTLDALLTEMVSLRLSHGYQVVVGDAVREAIGDDLCDISAFLDPNRLSKHGKALLMCMGNTIQKLTFTDPERVHVTKYVKSELDLEHPLRPMYDYSPNVKTILAEEYACRSMELRGFSEEYPWETADNYLADGGVDSKNYVNDLRFWRTRFVLLPIEPPIGTWRPQHQNSEDNDEEIHILGIRALTQMWQRSRHVPLSERRAGPGRMSTFRKKDQNPLEIKYETLNASEIVATELDRIVSLEEAGEAPSTQLLPDSEKLDRDTSMVKLAQAMQGERGIDFRNRRWHLRLHYNCFHGEEFTNWLLHNVRTLETREDAVEFGNSLMKEGLFEHVNGRHTFKDGHYFYSLKPEFKAPRVDLKGSWFSGARRSDKSIPPTPLSEHASRDMSQTTTRSRSGSSLAFSLTPATPLENPRPFMDKRQKTVNMTKTIRIDVDTRKRSNRPELVDLHYDRYHNPENCYHIELSWLNATSKLVDDAVMSWTAQAEKYGLKLVEVPIAEAYRVPDAEPFRRAYRVKLALEPPRRPSISHIFTPNSFTAQPYVNAEKHYYHKAILKRFNFVLDIEGTSEFPENVNVQHSPAGLEYKYTQYIHRSGIGLAQITEEGEFLLLSNRLYNSRLTSSKEGNNARFDAKREPIVGPGFSHRPALPPQFNLNLNLNTSVQASGVIGLNMQSPKMSSSSFISPYISPTPRATSDVLNARLTTPTLSSSMTTSTTNMGFSTQLITPEQIKEDFESFCHDPVRLEQFYKEVHLSPSNGTHLPPPTSMSSSNSAPPSRKHTGDTSSSALKPIQDANEGIPEFVLPESVTSPSSSALSFGLGSFGGLMSRRARASVAYESVAEMFGRTTTTGSARASTGDVHPPSSVNSSSGTLELKVRVDTPVAGRGAIAEEMREGMSENIGASAGDGHGDGDGGGDDEGDQDGDGSRPGTGDSEDSAGTTRP